MLLITASILTLIQQQAKHSYPHECCGFLLGNEEGNIKTIVSIMACENKAISKENSFLISPQDYMKAENCAEEKELHLLGVFHSHPDCEALPSRTDLASAIPNFSYIIVSVTNDIINDTRCWILNDNSTFNEEEIYINQNKNSKQELLYGNSNYSYTLA